MIALTRFDGQTFWVNPHQIETVEQRPDTTLVLLSGKVILVKETAAVVRDKIVEYRRALGLLKNEE